MAYTFGINYTGPHSGINASATGWSPAEPITAAALNNIEAGIVEALNTGNDLIERFTTLSSSYDNSMSSIDDSITSIRNTAQEAYRIANDADNAADVGKNAWAQIENALKRSPDLQNWANLETRLNTERDSILSRINQLDNVETGSVVTMGAQLAEVVGEIRTARGNKHYRTGGANVPATSLADRLDDLDFQVNLNLTTAAGAERDLNAARGGQNSLADRLLLIDNGEVRTVALSSEVDAIKSEIATARGTNSSNQPNSSLNDRFTQDELLINQRMSYSDVKNNLTSTDTDKPLSALQGKVLNEAIDAINTKIGGNFNNVNTVAAAINNIELSAITSANTYADTNKVDKTDVYNDVDYTEAGKVLDARQGKVLNDAITTISTNYQAADTTLGGRITPLETEITNARTSSVIKETIEEEDEETHEMVEREIDKTYGSVDARLEAIESHAAAVRTDVNTIANELAMMDNGALVATNTRVDTLESDLRTIANELNMLDGTTIQANDTRVDSLETRVGAIDDASTGALKGITDRLTTVERDLNTTTTGIKDRMTAAEGTLSSIGTRVTTLENQPKSATVVIESVTYDSTTGNPTSISEPSTDVDYLLKKDDKYYYWKYIQTGSNPDTFVWALISGAGGGSGNTSGYYLTAAQYASLVEDQEYQENADYYVAQNDGYVHHYRYVMLSDTLTQIEIGTVVDYDNIKKYNMMTVAGEKTVEGESEPVPVTYLNLYEFDYGVDNTTIDTQSASVHLRAQVELPRGGDGTSSAQKTSLLRIGSEVIQKVVGSQILLRVFFSSYDASGSESSTGYATLRAGNTVIFSNRELSSYESATTPNPLTWQANTAGFHEFDVTEYCGIGNTNFTLSVEVGGTNVGKGWRVNLTDLRLESTAPDNLLVMVGDSYEFPYTPIGSIQKNLIVTIDKDTANESSQTIPLAASVSGVASTYLVSNELTHGKHTIEMQLSASIGGQTEYSNTIKREYIWYDITDTSTPIIIASMYENTTLDVTQYSTIEIPYQVYKKGASSITVEYYLDSEVTPYQTSTLTDTNVGTLAYIVTDIGAHSLKIQVDEVYITINLNVARSDKNLSPVTGAVIDFDPTMLSNSSENRLPSWTARINQVNQTYSFTASSNFNWSEDISGGGYKKDSNGDKCFIIKAGSYIDLDYPMFANDVFENGAEMKIVFKTAAVRNAEAVWYQNIGEISGKTVGIQLNAHNGWLKTDKAVNTTTLADEDSDEDTITVKGVTYTYWKPDTAYEVNDIRVIRNVIYRCTSANTSISTNLQDKSVDLDEDPAKSYMKKWLKIGQLDTEVLATNSYLYFPYSEEDKIELDININKNEAHNNFIMSYEDGVPSKAYAYTTGAGGDKITHNGTIRIGSDDCDVYIYHLRYYVKSLGTDQILQNFIADGKDLAQKVERYDRNCIYWNPSLNDGEGGYMLTKTAESTLDPIKLAEKMPNVKVLMLDTEVFTTGKKDFVTNSSLRCIHADGGNIYTSRGDEDNWLFINGFHAGQGTTSDNYGQSARNVDFLFEVDGVHYPTKAKNMTNYTPSNSYVSAVIKGRDASIFDGTVWSADYTDWTAETSYSIGDKVANNGTIYSCTRAHTSGETFEAAKWKVIGSVSQCSDWKADDCKISLTQSSVPNNYFNLKVNVASSENVNNALFQKRYNDFLTYTSPAQAAQVAKHHDTYDNIDDVKVKNCMEFVPAVLFVREHSTTAPHNEFNDTNWHLYALGNIGDSKKSDYTRAYDPDDMNEFTCENSDNNTNNGQFQSGVFTYQGHAGAIETDYNAWDNTKAYTTGDTVVYDGMVYTLTGADQAIGASWSTSVWTAITYTGWTDSGTPYFAPRTNPNPMEYTYPITPSQWNVKFGDDYLNRKHMTLVTEDFDGDHSFEFRYACKGDYRDGDLINDTNGASEVPKDPSDLSKGYKSNDDVQFDLNHDVMLAMYEWLVTSNETQYRNEAPEWFVKNAMEFFYAYTHYYTMMDNRAKNTFWHFAKTGVHRLVSRPVEALYHIYEVADGEVTVSNGIATGSFTAPTGDFNPSGTYYTQYAFDLWVYDTDTAAGIDNNGALVFPYGKEDEDYRVDGEPSSGYAFNGAGSIFWRRLKNTFTSEIAEVMSSADRNCFNSEHLIKEFDDFQNCFPEEIWRLDIERKYIRTYTGASIDNSITEGKQNARFLMSMMQGRKKYQRRQWIRDQGFYFNSKYNIGDISTNRTEFNIVSPAGDHSLLAVAPDYHLHLTPYQDMYLNVVVGNGTPIPPIRAKANTEYTIKLDDYTAGNFAETRVYIGGFKMISKLGNLAPMYPYSFTLNGLDHLKELDVGTDISGYRNGNFTELPLTNEVQLPLLEKLNIKNCGSLATSIGLKTANNLRVVEAAGSSIGGISLPDYSQIEVLHLPSTVTDVILHSARLLKDFYIVDSNGVETYSNLYTLNVIDSDYSENFKEDPSDPLPVDWMTIAAAMLAKKSTQTNLQLQRLSSATIGNIESLDIFDEVKQIATAVDLTGTINVTGTWSTIQRDYYGGTTTSVWPDLTFDVSAGTEQVKHKVTYRYSDYIGNDGNVVYGDVIKTIYVNDGAFPPDIYNDGTITEKPTRAQTVRNTYEFGSTDPLNNDAYIPYSGWKLSTSNDPLSTTGLQAVRSNITIETYFQTYAREYYVKWYLKRNTPSSLVKTSAAAVEYGGGYDLEAPTVKDIHAAGKETCEITVANGQATYAIFTGWEKLPTNIQPEATDTSYDIYATWDTGTVVIDDLFDANNLDNLTPVQLLVLSALDNTYKTNYHISEKISAGTRMTLTMGYEGPSGGTTLTGSRPLRLDAASDTSVTFDGNNASYPYTIQPLKENDDEFTLAIDYCFKPNYNYDTSYNAAALVSCYEYSSSGETRTGFGIFNNLTTNQGITTQEPRVGFGDVYRSTDQSAAIGTSNTLGNRNMIVFRHPAGSSTLYIYSGLTNNDSLQPQVLVTTRTWQNYNTDAYLNFGKIAQSVGVLDTTAQAVANGKGTIFWAKYWKQDLGQGECKKLAMWPHEQITYAISYLNSNSTSLTRVTQSGDVSPSIYLAALTASAHGKVVQSKQQISTFNGRDNSVARTVCNNRVFEGLPTQIQSIMCQPYVRYTQTITFDGLYKLDSTPVITKDYVFQYSAANLANTDSAYSRQEDTLSCPFAWFNSANVEAYYYDENSNSWVVNNGDPDLVNYLNMRFPFKAIKWGTTNKLRVFRDIYNKFSGDSLVIATTINRLGSIRSGDIFISANGDAFIYALNSEIQALGIQTMTSEGKYGTSGISNSALLGGWISTEGYWTRSAIVNGMGTQENFANTDSLGVLNTNNTNSQPSTGLNLMYSITI